MNQPSNSGYSLVRLASGVQSVHSLAYRETFHPVIGPVAEAEALYVKQLHLRERLERKSGEFVIWDIGLGAAANPITVIRAVNEIPGSLTLRSFDQTVAPLQFALQHSEKLGYIRGYEQQLEHLISERHIQFHQNQLKVTWGLQVADFPALLTKPEMQKVPKPNVIMFDAFSPATNPEMWTLSLFRRMFELLDPARPCALPTYSRSTMLRVTLLLAGFFVGVGHATGEKEETTIAANSLELIEEPLDGRWLQRAHRSSSAEPLHEPEYRQARLSVASWEQLQEHRQFR